ncbi:hypothetical protein CEXT_726691 [Caerostris extrusa]|uniref:Uncharacterized protein n=1 Tax=Caerostris extrusa TaxID=172846 RepID=A0AAV4PFA2_CAEEX|nr:hypothetical protein CEXT_726691 [Caerostris extrusa]
MQTLEESDTENPLKIQNQAFQLAIHPEIGNFFRICFYAGRKVTVSVHDLQKALVTDTPRCWKQALARHSETSGQKSALQTTREALQQPKEKHRNRIERASRFRWGTENARHTEMSLLF